MSIVATKFAGSIEGEYVPLTGARLDAETGVALDDGAALDGEGPGAFEEAQPVPSRASRPKATVETAADEIRLDRVTITSSDPLDVAIVAAGG